MKVIIAGGRHFNDYELLKQECSILLNDKNVEIICGMSEGADLLGKRFAEENLIKIHEFPANWNLYGKKAGLIRNIQMGDFADALIAFWNGLSTGTAHMINYAREINLDVTVIKY